MSNQIIRLPFRSLKGSVEVGTGPDDAASDGVAGHTAGNTFNADPTAPNTGTFYLQTPSARGDGAIQLDFGQSSGPAPGDHWEDWGSTLCENHDWWYFSNALPGDEIMCPSLPQSNYTAYANIVNNQLVLSTGANQNSIMYCIDTDGLVAGSMTIKIPSASASGVAGAYLWLRVDGVVKYFDFAGNLHGNDVGFNGGAPMTIEFEAGSVTTINFTVQASLGSEAALTVDYIDFVAADLWEPWDGPAIDSKNPWFQTDDQYTVSGGKLLYDMVFPLPFTPTIRLRCFSDPEDTELVEGARNFRMKVKASITGGATSYIYVRGSTLVDTYILQGDGEYDGIIEGSFASCPSNIDLILRHAEQGARITIECDYINLY